MVSKGDSGVVGVFGGSKEYTGAPFFSAIAALRNGCDLSYVFCHSAASFSIKSLSPDLIVIPFDDEEVRDSLTAALNRVHCLIIGPGLSRNERNFDLCARFIKESASNTAIIDGV